MAEKEVRERIKQKTNQTADKANQVTDKVADKADQVTDKVGEVSNKVSDKVEDAVPEKMKKNGPSSGKYMKGILIGTAIGATLSLFSSPKSGKEVRGKIKEGYGKTINKGKQAMEKAEALPEEVELWSVQKTDRVADKVIKKAEKVKDNISENYEYVTEDDEEQDDGQENEQQGSEEQESEENEQEK